tara:strand:- start:452 stop:988 length:537 start_codon:yes stop_codon:yes gene_type:complete
MTDAAKIVGISRSTLYEHIEEKGISVDREDKKRPTINVSELIRIYGDDVNPDNLKGKKEVSDTVQSDNLGKVARVSVEYLEESYGRERQKYEEQIQYLKDIVEDQKEQTKRITLLLENHSQKDTGDEWKAALHALESKVSNQEKEGRDERQKILRQNKALKDALEAEKNKSFWKKLFG